MEQSQNNVSVEDLLAEKECTSSILLQVPSSAFIPRHFTPLEMWVGRTNNKLPTKSSSSMFYKIRDERCLTEI